VPARLRAGKFRHQRQVFLLGPIHEVGGGGIADADVLPSGGPDHAKDAVRAAQDVRIAEQLAADDRLGKPPVEIGPVPRIRTGGEMQAIAAPAKGREKVGLVRGGGCREFACEAGGDKDGDVGSGLGG
jgi:hypothetical protein